MTLFINNVIELSLWQCRWLFGVIIFFPAGIMCLVLGIMSVSVMHCMHGKFQPNLLELGILEWWLVGYCIAIFAYSLRNRNGLYDGPSDVLRYWYYDVLPICRLTLHILVVVWILVMFIITTHLFLYFLGLGGDCVATVYGWSLATFVMVFISICVFCGASAQSIRGEEAEHRRAEAQNEYQELAETAELAVIGDAQDLEKGPAMQEQPQNNAKTTEEIWRDFLKQNETI